MVVWLWNEQGAHRIEDPRFVPTFFLHTSPSELSAVRRRIEILDGVREVREVSRRIALEDDESRPVLEIVPRHYRDLREIAHILDSNGGYVDHRLFNVDLRFSQRYAMEHGIFPMGLVRYTSDAWRAEEEHFALDYPLPPLTRSLLDIRVDNPMGMPRMQDKLLGARVDEDEVDGDEVSILKGIEKLVRSKDPDVLLTDGGDVFTMPYLARKAAELGVNLQLGRDPEKFTERKGTSYFTYGKIVYKPGQYILRGRLHLDRGHFAYRESEFAGLAELSRLSTLTPQEQARLTPGTAITAMQVNQAHRDGCLVLWKKNQPEDFKTVEDLVRGDRGGFIFEPEIGLHEGLYELDFFALYPSIMVKYNISPETLDCRCCALDGRSVPELKYHLCTRRLGLIPRVLKPVLERRRYYKRMKKELGPLQEVYTGRDTILKWLLVTCFSADTLVPYRLGNEYRIDRIDSIVNRYLPDETGVAECKDNLRVFSYDSQFRPVEKRVAKVLKAQGPEELLKIKIKGNRELLVTPNHRFFVFNGSKDFEVRTADELRPGDLIPVATKVPLQKTTPVSVNLAKEVLATAPKGDLFSWRVRGETAFKAAIAENYDLILPTARSDGYTYRAIWLWRRTGILPLKYLGLLSLSPEVWDGLEIGRARRGGGKIQFLPARVDVDEDVAFLLGFYVGDGSASGNMVRFGIGMTESEIVGKLLDILFHNFRFLGRVFKERKANMWVLQVNSIAFKEILRLVFGVGWSSESGKLVIPKCILNSPEEIRWEFLAGLIASDGYVDENRDWSFVASANRDFVLRVGFLALTLGLDIRFRTMRPNKFPLHTVDLKTSEIRGKIWLKDSHRQRAGQIEDRGRQKEGFEFAPVKAVERVPYENPHVYCFEVADDPHGFVTIGGAFIGQSFGYTGYKNARFGRIECHEAINAYARDILVRTMEIAESHRYEVVHGIVDSVWLRPKPDADPIEKVREHIAGSIGLPIELEGRYKWIVFLPCKTTGVGALNRYYGLYEHDEFKLRGIELRKHDTPEFINICQEAMLGELSLASNAAEFRERVPRAVDVLRWTAKRVLDRAIPVHQFILTKSVSRTLPEYVVLTATAAALKQMEKRGFSVEPGESIRYVLLDARARESERKIRVAEFLEGHEEPDAWEYIRLLCRSGQTLLAPFGYTEEGLLAMCRDLSDVTAPGPSKEIDVHGATRKEGHSRARGGVGYARRWHIQEDEETPGEIPAET